MKTFKTPKGTELPLLNLKGKDYLQAQHRLVWFREEKPEWSIETEIVSHDADHSICRATIRNEAGRIMAQGTKEETRQGFGDHLEKSETGAVARALALVGFGTQFAQELDEGERLADSPAPRPYQNAQNPSNSANSGALNSPGVGGVARKTDKRVTEPQLKRLFAIKNKCGVSDEQVKTWVKEFGKESTKDLWMSEYEDLIAKIEHSAKK